MVRNITPPPAMVPSHPAVLGSLGDRDGWDAAPGGNGWTHKGYGITVVQAGTYVFEISTPTGPRRATSATGALCIIDQVIAAQAAE